MLAVSGKDGALLWLSPESGPDTERSRPGSVRGQPVSIDVDGDGVSDLIAVFSTGTTNPTAAKRRVAAVSGRSGHRLWGLNLEADTPRSDMMLIRLNWSARPGVGRRPALAGPGSVDGAARLQAG